MRRFPELTALADRPAPVMTSGRTRAALMPLAWAAAFLILCAFGMDRYGAVDEIGLINPAYMFAHTGRMTYPAHYFHDEMVVHPPAHYAAIGLLMKAGVPLYYAEAIPTVAWHLVLISAIVAAPFDLVTRIALLVGAIAPVVLLHNSVQQVELFGMRPEGEINAAWLTGLVMLETGRRRGWSAPWLAAGAAALSYAGSLHYYAAAAWLAVPGYAIVAARELDRRRLFRRVAAAVALGTAVVAGPMLALFVVPHWSAIIRMVTSLAGGGSLSDPIYQHLAQYALWRSTWNVEPLRQVAWISGAAPFLLARVPLVLAAVVLVAWRRDTRAIAFSSLPLLLTLFLAARHKHAYYFVHELSLLALGFWGGILGLAVAWRRVRPPKIHARTLFAASLALGVALILLPPRSGDIRLTAQPRVHEAELARAAGITILGSDAIVGGRTGPWFISGARHWLGLELDVVWATAPNVIEELDAVVETYHISNTKVTTIGPNLATLYARGLLHLRGFYIASPANSMISYVLLTDRPVHNTQGFGMTRDTLFRVTSVDQGPYRLTAAVCSGKATSEFEDTALFSQRLLLPDDGQTAVHVVTAVRRPEALPANCHAVENKAASITPVDRIELMTAARDRDGVMRFYRDSTQLPARRARSSN